ncbi:MAG: hypothetical protein DMF64_01650, partial [Acidobacteria bacterium]
MPDKAFELVGDLGLNVAGAQTALRQFERDLDKSAAKMERAFEGAGRVVGRTVSVMLGDVGGAVTALTNITSGALGAIPVVGGGLKAAFDEAQGAMRGAIETGFAFNDMMKRESISLTLITGDAHRAAEELTALRRISANSEFGLPALASAARGLELMGLKAQLVVPAVQAIANAAAATGKGQQGFLAISDVFQRVLETGKASSRDLRALINQDIDVLDIFARAFKTSKASARRLIDSGQMGAQDFVAILLADFNKRYPQAAAEMAKTIETQSAKFNSGRAAIFGTAVKKTYDEAVAAYEQGNQAIRGPMAQQMAESFNSATEKIGRAITTAIQKLSSGDLLGGIIETGRSISAGLEKGIIEKAEDVYNTVTSIAPKVVKAAKNAFESNSPSELMAREVGMPISQGIAKGFNDDFEQNTKPLILEKIDELLNDPRVRAFLEVIKKSEVGNDRSPYTRAFGPLGHVDPSTINVFDRSTWPGMQVMSPSQHRMVWTHPYGAYQAEPGTYQDFARQTGVRDLSPQSQDRFAVWDLLSKHSAALNSILGGDAGGAMSKLGKEWESFGVNGPKKIQSLIDLFDKLTTAGLPAFAQATQQAATALQSLAHSTPQNQSTNQPAISVVGAANVIAHVDLPEAHIHAWQQFSLILPEIKSDLKQVGEAAQTDGDLIERAGQIATGHYSKLRRDLIEWGFTSQNITNIFEQSFTGAFQHIGEGFHGMLLDFTQSFLSAIQQMAAAALAAELGKKLFGASAGGTGGGWLGAIFSFLGIAAGAATGGGGGSVNLNSVSGYLNSIGHHAMGGKNVTGLSWVGENGAELVNFGGSGADIYSNADS